jgi:hypothetical protein
MIALALAALLYAPLQLDATPAPVCDLAAVAACAPADRPVVTPWPTGADNPPDPLYPVEPLMQGDDYPRPTDVPAAAVDEPPPPAVAPIVLVATGPAAVAPAPARHLAHTGVPAAPYLAMSAALICAGVLLRRAGSVRPTGAAQSAD